MIDYYLKFPDQATMLEALRPLGLTYIAQEPKLDENGNYVYIAKTFQESEVIYDEEGGEPVGREPLFDDQGNPVMGEWQEQVYEDVEKVSQGGHQFACWEVGLLPDSPTDWHLNLRVVDPEFDVSSLEQYAVFPKMARCVWA